jgi:hypothetical protein
MSLSTENSKTSKLHLGLFAFSLLGEVNNIRKQYSDNDNKLIYLSSTLSQLELLCELTFAHLNETVEPLIYFFEAFKALLRLKEYIGLITTEKMGCYISKELYEVHKKDEEKMKSMVMLPRSKKCIPKPDKFSMSNKMIKYALKSVNSIDSLQSLDEMKLLSDPARLTKHSASANALEDLTDNKGIFTRFFNFWCKKFKYAKKLLGSRKFKISEIMLILRPVLYMFLFLKFGPKSYVPIAASLLIEIFGIFIGLQKLAKCKNESERQELSGRWKGLFKYALKEPIFSQYTVKIVYKLLYRFINQGKISFVLSILSYFKYYCYIV